MTKKKITFKINCEKCKGCSLCIGVCPQKILKLSDKINKRGMQYIVIEDEDKCTACGLCIMMCPDSAIEIIEKE